MYLHVYNCVSAAVVVDAVAAAVLGCFVYKFAYAFFIFCFLLLFFSFWILVLFCFFPFFLGQQATLCSCLCRVKKAMRRSRRRRRRSSRAECWQMQTKPFLFCPRQHVVIAAAAAVAKQCKKCLDKLKIRVTVR